MPNYPPPPYQPGLSASHLQLPAAPFQPQHHNAFKNQPDVSGPGAASVFYVGAPLPATRVATPTGGIRFQPPNYSWRPSVTAHGNTAQVRRIPAAPVAQTGQYHRGCCGSLYTTAEEAKQRDRNIIIVATACVAIIIIVVIIKRAMPVASKTALPSSPPPPYTSVELTNSSTAAGVANGTHLLPSAAPAFIPYRPQLNNPNSANGGWYDNAKDYDGSVYYGSGLPAMPMDVPTTQEVEEGHPPPHFTQYPQRHVAFQGTRVGPAFIPRISERTLDGNRYYVDGCGVIRSMTEEEYQCRMYVGVVLTVVIIVLVIVLIIIKTNNH